MAATEQQPAEKDLCAIHQITADKTSQAAGNCKHTVNQRGVMWTDRETGHGDSQWRAGEKGEEPEPAPMELPLNQDLWGGCFCALFIPPGTAMWVPLPAMSRFS